jgi:hypothetical protein
VLTLSDKKDPEISVFAKGYADLHYKIETRLNLTTLLNMFWGGLGLVGLALDYYTDHLWVPNDDELFFELDPIADQEDSKKSKEKPVKGAPKSGTPKSPPSSSARESISLPAPSKTPDSSPPPAGGPPTLKPQGQPNQKPLTAAEKARLAEQFPTEEVQERIANYYGRQDSEKLKSTENRIYQILKQMEDEGTRPDLDEAIRLDWFQNVGQNAR